MNPDSFFREVLESHELRSSDRYLGGFGHGPEHTPCMSDNAILLDTVALTKLRRYCCIYLVESAVTM